MAHFSFLSFSSALQELLRVAPKVRYKAELCKAPPVQTPSGLLCFAYKALLPHANPKGLQRVCKKAHSCGAIRRRKAFHALHTKLRFVRRRIPFYLRYRGLHGEAELCMQRMGLHLLTKLRFVLTFFALHRRCGTKRSFVKHLLTKLRFVRITFGLQRRVQ